jgi:hypothetical protein
MIIIYDFKFKRIRYVVLKIELQVHPFALGGPVGFFVRVPPSGPFLSSAQGLLRLTTSGQAQLSAPQLAPTSSLLVKCFVSLLDVIGLEIRLMFRCLKLRSSLTSLLAKEAGLRFVSPSEVPSLSNPSSF